MFVDFPMHQRPLKHHSKTSALYSRKMPPNSYIDSCESSYYISFHDPSSRSSWTKSQILKILISPGKKNNSINSSTFKLCWGFAAKSGPRLTRIQTGWDFGVLPVDFAFLGSSNQLAPSVRAVDHKVLPTCKTCQNPQEMKTCKFGFLRCCFCRITSLSFLLVCTLSKRKERCTCSYC